MTAVTTRTVLIVDDSELLLEMASFHLEQSGFNVVTASDRSGVREALAGSSPDLIILDVEMPDLSPADLIELLDGCSATIWLFSAFDGARLAERAAAIGASDHVRKDEGLGELARRARALFEL